MRSRSGGQVMSFGSPIADLQRLARIDHLLDKADSGMGRRAKVSEGASSPTAMCGPSEQTAPTSVTSSRLERHHHHSTLPIANDRTLSLLAPPAAQGDSGWSRDQASPQPGSLRPDQRSVNPALAARQMAVRKLGGRALSWQCALTMVTAVPAAAAAPSFKRDTEELPRHQGERRWFTYGILVSRFSYTPRNTKNLLALGKAPTGVLDSVLDSTVVDVVQYRREARGPWAARTTTASSCHSSI